MGTKALQYIFHHVAFPPKLPLEPEGGQNSLDRELLLFVKAVLDSFVSQRAEDVQNKWKPVLNMVDTWLAVDTAGTLNRHQEALAFALLNLKTHGAVALHISAQNCGWLAYYDEQKNKAILDAFEASATLSAVQEAPGPIIRCFPGQSVSIPIGLLDNPRFCDYLAQSLCSLDLEVVREMYPKGSEHRDSMQEDWDTVHPGLITEKLMVELLAFGEHNVWKSFEKHVRDEINIGNDRHPWRRSPLWLVLRVALQTVLYRAFPNQEGRFEYKNLMLYLVAEFASVTLAEIESNTTHPAMPDIADVLTLTNAKYARRVYKLRDKAFEFVLQRVRETNEAIATRLQADFRRIRCIYSPKIPHRFDSARESDFETSLKHSRKYLRNAKLDTPPAAPTIPFRPNHSRRRQKQINGLFRLKDDETESLVDFEMWVDAELQNWCSTAQPLDKACCGLAELIGTYSRYASKKYAGIPELTSLMLLVILECWVSLDKLCVQVCGSLAKFSPELPKNLLQHLLLPRRREMIRAQAVEEYIASRLDGSSSDTSIFEDPGSHTFAALFFKASRKCRSQRAKIVENFQKERDDRQRRCKDLWQKHENLLNEASKLSHDTDEDEDESHLPYCRKCQLQQDAARLSIGIHEWPLPDDEDLVENVVFELTCPEWFAQWRDVTWMILDDYGRSQTSESARMEVNLLEYPALREYHDSRPRRLTLASATKSWVDSHFSTQKIPVGPEQIVVSSGLHFCLWDTKKEAWVKDRRNTSSPSFKQLCTFYLNATAYAGLQYAVETSHHNQNQIIAEQRTYQSQLNLHNMIAFGQLRLGERLQWYNILREIASSSISLNERPVHELFCQAAWQLGPFMPGKWLREAHVFFEDLNSVTRLWETLEHRLSGIQHNWNEFHTLQTIVVLGLRSLSLGPQSAVEQAMSFLRRCRGVAMEWCAKLKASVESSLGENTQGKLNLMLHIGGICLLTFSVDSEHLPAVLHTQEDLQSLLQASLLVFENSIISTGTVPIEVKAMVLRTSRVLCHTEQEIHQLIGIDCSGLTRAVKQSSQGLEISTPWRFLEGNNSRWVTSTSPDSSEDQQEFHYNILTGELRINNELPGRLPEDITKAALYRRLFGQNPLAVARSRLRGSRFKSVQLFGKYRIYFRSYGGEVIVFAREERQPKKPGRILRYIPHESLQGDFPDSLVTCYTHWLDIKDGKLEFRPLENPWQESDSNWSMGYHEYGSAFSSTRQGHRKLADVHGEFFGRVASVLGKLDIARHITVTKSLDGTLEAKLDRLSLTFFVNQDGALECREHNSIVDSSQDIGCLYGLFNKLVLRDKTGHSRRVLIPYGTIRVGRGTSHTEVFVDSPNASRVKYYQYSVDVNLGALLDTSGTTGSLYLAYLHAVTSFVLPDPMTNRSGTEEALHMLRQAKMKTSSPLGSDCVNLLGLIASLTPHRQCYPPINAEQKVTSVQKVKWIQNLSSVAQHDDFRWLAQEIYSHAGKFAPFHGRKMEPCPGLSRGDIRLLEKARNRNMHFYRSGFGGASANQYVPPPEYKARDRSETESARSRRVYEIARLAQGWPATLSHKDDLIATIKAWGVMELEDRSPGQSTYTSLLEKPIQALWATLYGQCQSCNGETDKHKLMSIFCTIAFGHPEVDYLHSLLAIAVWGGFPPIPEALKGQSVDLTLKPGQAINDSQAEEIRDIISTHYPPLERMSHKGKNLSRNEKGKISRERRKDYERKKASDVEDLERVISIQWPCGALRKPPGLEPWKSDCFDDCDDLFRRWSQNVQFRLFIQAVQDRLDTINIIPRVLEQPPPLPPRNLIYPRTVPWHLPDLHDLMLLANAPSPMDTDQRLMGFKRSQQPADVSADLNDGLQALIDSLRKGSKPLRQEYANDLSESLRSLKNVHLPCAPTRISADREALVNLRNRLSDQRDSLWAEINNSISPVEGWAEVGQTLWPSITILSILSFLASDKWSLVPAPWKKPLLILAKLIALLRQSERLIMHFDNEDSSSFYKEAEAVECEGWDPAQIPEWLLLEIEGNLTIRARQADVARRMVEGQENSVLQLTMGEGKTTVITPMVALRLSNGSQISRLIVLKPLLRQSMNLLSQRLGGLLNRPVYHIPFSRNTRISETTTEALRQIYDECLEKRGILIVLPEQLLSFRLVGLDYAKKDSTIAHSLVELELLLQERCRTVIDESDEVLDPKFQLVYTRGHQQNLDGEADRWGVIMYVLEEVKKQAMLLHLHSLGKKSGLSVDQQGARYPFIHFFATYAADILLEKVLEAIENGAVPGLSFQDSALPIQVSTMNFIRYKKITEHDKETVRRRFEGSLVLKRLLVLRGLFAYNILHFALTGKRWLVDYGIHPTRSLLAVPFRAKGVPSDSAMFGHPEVTLVLTCLSYYYEGLKMSQVRQCVSLLKEEDDPEAEYERWIMQCRDELPRGLHSFSGVNVDDTPSFEQELYPHLQYQKGLIDFFLSRVVFPRDAKEYPFKLSTSAWDIPSRPNYPLTTGFSGTNDNRYLLPRSMPQKDLPDLLHTNAMVLARLLLRENQQCILAQDDSGDKLSDNDLLLLINDQNPRIRVIIDVGAQILELSNRQVAIKWLSVSSADLAAAVFFDEEDEPMVIDRDGQMERLLASPFSQQMHRCLVFLDQHHSRGVDLKLPHEYRAAITLGPRLTKDRLVQACHRMRELGNGQSVAFFMPPEVKHSLKDLRSTYTSFDVLQWVLEQTCDQLERLEPLWAAQGLNHFRAMQIWESLDLEEGNLVDKVDEIQERESKSLRQLYSPWSEDLEALNGIQELAQTSSTVAELHDILKRSESGDNQLHEEQEQERERECEVMHQVQREPHVCLPPPVQPMKHTPSGDIEYFVKHACFPGYLSNDSHIAIECFATTSAEQFEIPDSILNGIFVTTDFIETITQTVHTNDEFLKPVHWVLSNIRNSSLLIISQFEANELLTKIRESEKTTLHIYAPRITKDMRSFSKLDFLSIGAPREGHDFSPEILRALEVFSGSLYFDTYEEYESAQQFFGFRTASTPIVPEGDVTSEGFVAERARNQVAWPVTSPFKECPLAFLNTWFSIRTKGHGFSKSHMGSIIEAKPLTREQFEGF